MSTSSQRKNEVSDQSEMKEGSQRSFSPYQSASLESPMFHIIFQPFVGRFLGSILSFVYRTRWLMSYPMGTKFVPRWMVLIPQEVRNITVGQLILTVPLVVFFLRCYHSTFVAPDLKENGVMTSYAIFFAFLTANKSNSVFSFVLGIPYERMIPLHKLSALVAVTLGCFHTYVAFVYGGDDDGDSKHADFGEEPSLGKFLFDTDTNRSGSVVLGTLMALLGLSFFGFIRRLLFNLWYISHICLSISVLVALFLHDVSSGVFVSAWLVLDWVVRYGIMVGCRNRAKAEIRLVGGKSGSRESFEPAVELSFPKPPGFEYNPGQFVRIAIPKLSIFEFHPISISSAPHEPLVTLHIRELGDWTRRLVELAVTTESTPVWMEGPYGSLSVDLNDEKRYKMALFVCGGIGVTPCRSVANSLLYQHQKQGRLLKELKFVWAVRDMRMVDDLPPFESDTAFGAGSTVARSSDSNAGTQANVQADIYLTRRDEIDAEYDMPYNTYKGRPGLDKIFSDMKERALEMGESSIAVCGCGPKALMVDLQEACRKHSISVVGCGKGVFFDLHVEHFDL